MNVTYDIWLPNSEETVSVSFSGGTTTLEVTRPDMSVEKRIYIPRLEDERPILSTAHFFS